MCRVPTPGPSAPEIAEKLFVDFDLFVKHCAGKPMPDADRYLRIASRTGPENDTFVQALRHCLD